MSLTSLVSGMWQLMRGTRRCVSRARQEHPAESYWLNSEGDFSSVRWWMPQPSVSYPPPHCMPGWINGAFKIADENLRSALNCCDEAPTTGVSINKHLITFGIA